MKKRDRSIAKYAKHLQQQITAIVEARNAPPEPTPLDRDVAYCIAISDALATAPTRADAITATRAINAEYRDITGGDHE